MPIIGCTGHCWIWVIADDCWTCWSQLFAVLAQSTQLTLSVLVRVWNQMNSLCTLSDLSSCGVDTKDQIHLWAISAICLWKSRLTPGTRILTVNPKLRYRRTVWTQFSKCGFAFFFVYNICQWWHSIIKEINITMNGNSGDKENKSYCCPEGIYSKDLEALWFFQRTLTIVIFLSSCTGSCTERTDSCDCPVRV